MPPMKWTAMTSSASSNLKDRLEREREVADQSGKRADRQRGEGADEAGARGDGRETGYRAGDSADRRGLALGVPFDDEPDDHTARCGDVSVHQGLCRNIIGGQSVACVESEPAEPQDACADQRQRHRVRDCLGVGPSRTFTDHQQDCQGGGAGGCVDDNSAGPVLSSAERQPAFGIEEPVRNRGVDDDRPQHEQNGPAQGLEPVCGRTGDQRGRDDREHHLIDHERQSRYRDCTFDQVEARGGGCVYVLQAEQFEVTEEAGTPVSTEREAVSEHDPGNRDESEWDEVLLQHDERTATTHQTGVEEGESGNHEENQTRGDQHPRRVPTVYHCFG